MREEALSSFIEVPAESDFPIQNLPYGVFSTRSDPMRRVGVAIGDQILDLAALELAGALEIAPQGQRVFGCASMNRFMALGREAWTHVRGRVSSLLRADNPELRDDMALRERALVPMRHASLHLPVEISGYTDFYSSKEHATNVGSLFRDPKNALCENWLEIPIAYNGRASSVFVSGTPVRRPNGETKALGAQRPSFGPSLKLDFELETAFLVGQGNAIGEPIPVPDAERHIFGMVLMNDWSARDIQRWEYVPLGPFNGKSFATSISPWIVTLDALEPFRVAGPRQDPMPLPYLRQRGEHAFDIQLEVRMRPAGAACETTICRSNFKTLYWSMAQQLAHHTISGCNTQPGDLMGSGTISGATRDSSGSLLELTRNGGEPLTLANGVRRSFLEDGDEVIMTGWCQGPGYRVGFGDVSARIEPAVELHWSADATTKGVS
ncbi:fumarylacetoacetase [bacterium]|nr:MAG: fumarylacetoacetase [bacterium]